MTTILELLDYKPQRWYPSHKEAVIKAILNNQLTLPAVNELYGISAEEIQSWISLYTKHGKYALRTTRTQAYK